MSGLLIALHVVVCLFLIFVILLQPGRGGSMGSAMGGGGTQVFGGQGPTSLLAKVTEVCALIFMITSLSLAYQSSRADSVLMKHRPAPSAPAPAKTAAPSAPSAPAQAPAQPAKK